VSWLDDPWTANLYHFGHGDPNGVGKNNAAGGAPWVTKAQIGAALYNGYTGSVLGLWDWGFHAGHPYRFVFLDACDTSRGDLCVAFGIEKEHTAADYYTQRGIEPQAFIGWPDKRWLTRTLSPLL
jgi:hypothetical protein